MHPALFSSAKGDWGTPAELYESLNSEFRFICDVCASEENTLCPTCYFTESNSCLTQNWPRGACYMNPPYGRDVGKFMSKAYEQSKLGSTVVCLVPSRTDTNWWHSFVQDKASEIRFIKGRLKFKGASSSSPFPSALVIYKGVDNASS